MSAHQTYAGAGGSQSEALAQNHPEDIAPLRAQREANGDLVRLLIDLRSRSRLSARMCREPAGSILALLP
jgi:hypothetical protein